MILFVLFKFLDVLIYVYGILPGCVYVYHVLAPVKAKEGIRSSGDGVLDGCEPPCEWEPPSSPINGFLDQIV